MSIDLFSPFWATVIGGLIVTIVIGLFTFLKMALAKQIADQKLLNLISEIDSLKKEHEKVVSDIKKSNRQEIIKVMDTYDKKFDEFIKKVPSKVTGLTYKIENDEKHPTRHLTRK